MNTSTGSYTPPQGTLYPPNSAGGCSASTFRTEAFPYGISGVAIPSYSYGELYTPVSSSFPRKSRMCCYCSKIFTRSTTRRYHEKRCPLLRAAGSLSGANVNNNNNNNNDSKLLSADVKGENDAISPPPLVVKHSASSPVPYFYRPTDERLLESPAALTHGIKHEPLERLAQSEYGDVRTSQGTSYYPQQGPGATGSSAYISGSHNGQQQPVLHTSITPTTTGTHDGYIASKEEDDSESEDESLLDETEAPTLPQSQYPSHHNGARDSDSSSDGYEDGDDTPPAVAVPNVDKINGGHLTAAYPNSIMSDGLARKIYDPTECNGYASNMITSHPATLYRPAVMNHVIPNRYPNAYHQSEYAAKLLHASTQQGVDDTLSPCDKGPFPCSYCGMQFSQSASRFAHERTHVDDKPFICIACGSSFTRKYSLKLHEKRRHINGPCMCRECNKMLSSLAELKAHAEAVHANSKSSVKRLSTLGMKYDPLTLLQNGREAAEEEDQSPTGSRDNMSAASGSELSPVSEPGMPPTAAPEVNGEPARCRSEILPQEEESPKPYECPICKKRFGYKNNMKSHIKLHGGLKPFQCYVCGARFTRGSTLRRHVRRHGIIADSVWDLISKSVQHQQDDDKSTPVEQSPSNVSSENHDTDIRGSETPVVPEESVGISKPSVPSSFYQSLQMESTGHPALSAANFLPYTSAPSVLSKSSLYANYYSQHLACSYILPPNNSSTSNPDSGVIAASPTNVPSCSTSQLEALNLSTANREESQVETHSMMYETVSENSREANSSLCTPQTYNIGVQANLCRCETNYWDTDANRALDRGSWSPVPVPSDDMSPVSSSCHTGALAHSPRIRDLPSPQVKGQERPPIPQDENLASLLSTGRMFVCEHCQCYFTEYAMYRIHKKLHVPGKPYVCPMCAEDCHDKMYFALHWFDHLK